MRRLFLFFAIVSAIGASGCASVPVNSPANDKTFDSSDGYRLLRKNNDIWLEKLDGSEKKQITNSPDIWEDEAYLINNGKYIMYLEANKGYRSFITDIEGKNKTEIAYTEFREMKQKEKKKDFPF